MSNNLVTLEDAAFGYDGRAVVKGVSLVVAAGSYLCIVGENGSGKSTLLKGLLGLLKPLSGRIVCGASLKNGGIGYLSQAAAAKQDFPAGVTEIVLTGFTGRMGMRPFYKHDEKQKAARVMDRLGIAGLGGRCFRELSGGQQRRALLARALCAINLDLENPLKNAGALLALDEPAAGLDPASCESLYELLAQINNEMGIAIVMVSHDIGNVQKYAKEIITMENGVVNEN
jgi:zinc transport system ATP-binding protein